MKIIKDGFEDLTMLFEYRTPSGKFEVEVCYITEEEVNRIRESSKKPTWRQHQRVDQLDEFKFQQKLLSKAFVGLKGAKRKNLRHMIEPSVKIELNAKETWEDNLNFTPELKADIVENVNADFAQFLVAASRETEAFVSDEKKEEIENLLPGSGTGKTKT